jgi:hypothetical protein
MLARIEEMQVCDVPCPPCWHVSELHGAGPAASGTQLEGTLRG